jgi:hypothetical protein
MNVLRFANPLIETRQQYDMILFQDDIITFRVNVNFILEDTDTDISNFGVNYITSIYPSIIIDSIIIDAITDGNV